MFYFVHKAINLFFGFFYKVAEFFNKDDSDEKITRLIDRIYWVAIEDGVVFNKDGSMQVTFCYRGPDLDSAVKEELVGFCYHINNVLRRLSSGWALYAEAQRVRSREYVKSDKFPDDITRLIEEERYNYFSQGENFESIYYLTLQYFPPSDMQSKVKNMFIEGEETKEQTTGEEHLKYFLEETGKIFWAFKAIFSKENVYSLTTDETMTYLHSTISVKNHAVRAPENGMYIDSRLCDSILHGGFKPKLENHHVRIVSILKYDKGTIPGIFDKLNRLNFEYRWMSRFIFPDKETAKAVTKSYQDLWLVKTESIGQQVSKFFFGESGREKYDKVAEDNSLDAEAATNEISGDIAAYGYYTGCVVITDENKKTADEKAKIVEAIFKERNFTPIIESYNAVNAWFGSLPGMLYRNRRKAMLSTINLSHMMPASSMWAGQETNEHLNGPVLLYTQTEGKTPFRLDAHIGELGHSMILGPSGSGKSTHLALWAAQFPKYENASVYIFDTGGSSRVLTAGVGGKFYDLAAESEKELSFQPLSQIDDENERMWVRDWLEMYLESQGITMTEKHRDVIWSTLTSVAHMALHTRTMTTFWAMVSPQMPDLGLALKPLTIDGALGRLFDSKVDNFKISRWQVFEMETLMKIPSAIAPTLSYLFHKIEQNLNEDSDPTILFLDECWKYLKVPMFMTKIEEWLRVLRKCNTSVVFATQNLEDIATSPIAATIINNCGTKIFLPNPAAVRENMIATYLMFGLNNKEIEEISRATRKKEYYYKSELGSRKYDLVLGDIALAYCGAGSKQEQLVAKKILAEYGQERFNEKWLEHKGMPEVWEKIKKERVR